MPRPAPPTSSALAALHRRFAPRLRTGARWLGIEAEEERDAAVAAAFAGLAEDVPRDTSVAWTRLVRRLMAAAEGRSPASAGGGAEAALFAFLARRSPAERAVFVLAELGGLDADALARAIGAPPESGRAQIVALRRALADDRAAQACGGPAALLRACLAEDAPPPGWRAAHWGALEARLWPRRGASAWLAAAALAGAAWTVWQLGRPGPVAVLEPIAEREAELPAAAAAQERAPAPPAVAAPTLPPPPLLPPPAAAATPPMSKVVSVRSRRTGGPKRAERLATRAAEAEARDPGAVIVELEMLSAARKALAGRPAQALAYVEQHAREFPRSQLADQEAELRVRALCGLGRAAEARAEAARKAWPKVQAALREACGG